MTEFLQIVTYASIGGIIPCLFWLIFWLREDRTNPEPTKMIVACFIGGMLTTLIVFPFQHLVTLFIQGEGIITLALWSFIEESAKLGMCWYIAFRSRFFDEPIDAVIYMITVALGFAAFENTLYLISPLSVGDTFGSLMTGNLRFIGASILHTLSSAIIGVFIAFAFFKKIHLKEEYALVGLLCAGVLHTLFNFFILNAREGSSQVFMVFASVWLLIIVLILLVEKIKTIKNNPII